MEIRKIVGMMYKDVFIDTFLSPKVLLCKKSNE